MVEHADLFPEPMRERLTPLGNSEPYVNWYLQSTRPEAVTARRNVNGWYRSFPDRDKKLARGLRSKDNVKHCQALDELFTHHVLSQRPDRRITYEEGGVGPDFRIYRRNELVGSVEVLSFFQGQEWTEQEKRHGRLADELNRRLDLCHGYFLDFEVFPNHASVPPREFAEWIERQLKELPNVRDGSAQGVPHKQWAEPFIFESRGGGVRVHVRFFPVSPERVPDPGGTDRVVGGPFIGGFVADTERIRDRLRDKAGGRYDLRGAPYLVVVVVHSIMCDNEDFIRGLYGSSAVFIPSGAETRLENGFFGWDGSQKVWKNSRVSGVCAMAVPNTVTPEETAWTLYHNPRPRHRWPSDVLDATWEFRISHENDQGFQMDWLTTK